MYIVGSMKHSRLDVGREEGGKECDWGAKRNMNEWVTEERNVKISK